MPYRAGIIGCGRIAAGFDDDPRRGYVSTHAGAYIRTPGIELAALCDVDAARVQRSGDKYQVRGRYTDFREMLAHERLDLVSVCTWNDSHREIVEAAAAAGARTIFCEKPLADSLPAADAMVRACKRAGVLLLVDHQRRFDRFHQQIRESLHQGRLGRIQQVTCYYTAGITNTGSHLLDLLRFLFGEVDWVQAIPSRNPSANPQDPNLDGWLQFREGPLAALQACDVRDYTIFELNVLGTLGRLRVMSHGFDAQFEEARDSSHFAGYRELYPAKAPLDFDGSREFMLQAVNHLLGCLEGRDRPLCTGEDGRAALELICALRQAAECGRRVCLPLASSAIVIPSR